MLYKKVIQQLKYRRIALRIKTDELAYKIGVADSLIHSWESRKKIPNAENFFNWCNALECQVVVHQYKLPVDTWELSEENLEHIITNYGSEVDIEYEKKQFIDYYKANGTIAADWDAHFRNWIRRSIKFANNRGQAKAFNNPYDSKSIQERRRRIYDVASMGDKTNNKILSIPKTKNKY